MAERFLDLVDLCERSCATHAHRPLYGEKRAGRFVWTTYGEFHQLVARARAGLARLGVMPGDRVAMISNNRVEWAVAAHAVYGLGATFVPMYEAQLPAEWAFILDDCGAKMAITATSAIAQKLPRLEHVIALDDPNGWNALLRDGPEVAPRAIDPTSIAGFVYTSGTTGRPKGVMQSHRNLVENINSVLAIFSFEPDDRALSFLPWAHSYGQTCEVHGLMSMGCSVAINDRLDNLIANLAEVKPTILLAVPRIFNKLYQTVNEQIEAKPGAVQKLVHAGIRSAIKRGHGEHLSLLERAEVAFDEKAVFHKIRERFGGRLRFTLSASATLGRDVAEFIDAIGITVYEGYGLTEAGPIVSGNFPGSRRLGSVGKVIPGVRVVIDTSVSSRPGVGEIIVYGPNVMVGYHRRPTENEAAFTPDGGLRTGDLGCLDDDGFLYVTGRIKEQYKLTNGKYVVPSPLEEELKLSPFIANLMIHGDGMPHNVALVALDVAAIRKWAAAEQLTLEDDLTKDARVRTLVEHELETFGAPLKEFEKPRAFAMITDDLSVANGFLTPTLKLKRAAVLARYGALLASLYER
ncbi:MAG: AMP-dependent synthetase/ligase [Polyangiales bacterium]